MYLVFKLHTKKFSFFFSFVGFVVRIFLMLSPILRRLCVSSKASSNGSIDESPIGFKNNETAEISRDNETEEVSRELMSELKEEEQSIE